MKLSECKVDATLLRDAEFSKMGSSDAIAPELLVYADSLKYLKVAIENPAVCAIITTSLLADQVPLKIGLMVANVPRDVFYTIHEFFVNNSIYRLPFKAGIGKNCKIHPTALIEEGCCIGDQVVIGEYAVIRSSVWIGSRVTIDAGVKLGIDGILYRRTASGPRLIPHGGYVRIHDNAMLMANSVVVRSIHDTDVTEVGVSALIGLAAIVGHEAKVGARVVISNQCVIARKSIIGEDAFIGTQSMIKENIKVGAGAKVMAGSVVISDVNAGSSVSGNFATEHKARTLEYIRANRRQSIEKIN